MCISVNSEGNQEARRLFLDFEKPRIGFFHVREGPQEFFVKSEVRRKI